jgi:signal transduction histidine kinase
MAGLCSFVLLSRGWAQAPTQTPATNELDFAEPEYRNIIVKDSVPLNINIVADGSLLEKQGNHVVITPTTKRLVFQVGDVDPSVQNPNAKRLQFKLEGVDGKWNQRKGSMEVIVLFFSANDEMVGKRRFSVVGESPGWRNTVEASTFTQHEEKVVVPPKAARVRISISSAGPPDSVGLWIVKDLVITRSMPQQELPMELLNTSKMPIGPNPGPNDGLEGWIRDGTNSKMATMRKMPKFGPNPFFSIVDNDPLGHAEWHTIKEFEPAVVPGERLTISWDDMFSIGLANTFETAYGTLAPGHYTFHVGQQDSLGHPLPGETTLEIDVPRPYWSNPWFWIGCAVAATAIGVLVSRAVIQAKVRRVHEENMVERERLRIARDIHDDLGARLTHISLLSSLAESHTLAEGDKASFQKISEMTREMVSALYQTVWTVNPENDHLESLVNFLCQLINKMCESASIRCRIQALEIPENRPVTSEIRHNVSMVVKEIVNNALKHSRATEIQFKAWFENQALEILLADNGQGFEIDNVRPGNGLVNIRERIAAIGGRVSIESTLGRGSQFRLTIKIPHS